MMSLCCKRNGNSYIQSRACLVSSSGVSTCMQTGKWLEMAAIRHETTLNCGIGAIARYLCHRFTVLDSPPPNPHDDSKAWWVLFLQQSSSKLLS
jgi:hypothetical protein